MVTMMQLGQFYLDILQITLIDAIVLGAGAGMLASTYFGIKLKRVESGGYSWLLGGTAAVIFGTFFGYYIMNTVGFIVAWSGSSIQGLAGADLIEWTDTMATAFAGVQTQAAGFAVMGSLFGMGLGYGIASRPDDTSLLGNVIATLGIIAIVMGLLFMMLPSFITLPTADAFGYLLTFNVLILLCYGIGAMMIHFRKDTPSESKESTVEELIV
ncbi:MAG: hypothetical protein ACFFEV_04045 [Candidatus Thorarchaeota archaeon]